MTTDLLSQIQTAHLRDQEVATLPVTAGAIPLSYEAITDEWLTTVLCRDTTAGSVRAHTLGPADDGSWNRRRIVLEYDGTVPEGSAPPSVFCKAAHGLENRIVLGISGGARCEVMFYRDIRAALDIEAPTARYAALDPDSFNALIMLDDLGRDGTTFCDHHTRVTKGNATSQMQLLARLHAATSVDAAVRDTARSFPTWPEFFNDTLAFGMREGSEAGFAAAADVIPARLHARADEIWPATLRSVDAHRGATATLTHCDVHVKNWYITDDGRMGLFDWNCCSRGLGIRDVAYALSSALAPEDRRSWERELLALYLDELAAEGGPKLDFDDAFRGYRQQLITALTWWTVTLCPPPGLPDMQPRDTTLEFIRRIATAMDDLDTLDSLR